MDDSSLSSYSSDSDDDRKHHKRRHHNHDKRKRQKRSEHHKDDIHMKKLPPAQSDWEALRSHFQFVLPDEEEDPPSSGAKQYGSTWQDRMVQHYHSHLYKEYVLADLSRVLEIGKVGLRWRTEDEVKSGRGFRSCGNLKCQSVCNNNSSTSLTTEKKEAYDAVVRRSVGIGVPENGGKDPLGVVLPLSISSGAGEALDQYLKSCMNSTTTSGHEESDSYEDRHSRKRRKKQKKKHRKHSRSSSTPQDEEREEQKRLSQLPYGVGLYDYEVDFAYVEQNVNKRELVKVRLCLRCAPLLFAAKDIVSTSKNQDCKTGPATKAKNVRLMAMEAARDSSKDADDDEKESEPNVK